MNDNLLLESGDWLLLEDIYGVLLLEEQDPDVIGTVTGAALSSGDTEAVALSSGGIEAAAL